MKKYIVTVYNSRTTELTTVELFLRNLTEVEDEILKLFNGWGQITAIIVTF